MIAVLVPCFKRPEYTKMCMDALVTAQSYEGVHFYLGFRLGFSLGLRAASRLACLCHFSRLRSLGLHSSRRSGS